MTPPATVGARPRHCSEPSAGPKLSYYTDAMFNKLLIANRGEVALRIMRACAELDLPTVLVYSDADRDSLPVKLAAESYCIGPGAPGRSYLNIPSIVAVAEVSRADAVHPGYGFLAENARFSEICAQHNLKFIGPSAEIITRMGDKIAARQALEGLGVPVLPGSSGQLADEAQALEAAEQIGYPVMIKAAAGGGGLGMRVAPDEKALSELFNQAQQEALGAFGDGTLYLEKFLTRARHVELQIVADQQGHVLHLGERDCSVQRRNQKLLEESPAPGLPASALRDLETAGVKAMRDLGYEGLGTLEFLWSEGRFYFMEMNTRLQVEHPVTEMVTGLDLVAMQILIATGEPLALRQEDVQFRGHAIECRINAEDPDHGFRPSGGLIDGYIPPGGPGVRIDSHCYPGYTLPTQYDSLLAKLVVWGETRDHAIARMRRALGEYAITGIKTTIPFHERLMGIPEFKRGGVSTRFVNDGLKEQQEELV